MTKLQGYIRDTSGQPLSGIPILKLTPLPLVTDNIGYFESNLKELNSTNSNLFLTVIDVGKKFASVRDWSSRYKKERREITFNGRNATIWKSGTVENLDTMIEIIVNLNRKIIPSTYQSVVIGSGFGRTIISLSIANKYNEKNNNLRANTYFEYL
ncbi:MAG: hypothetical protein ACRD93_05885 [Nitrososphaeraceae archaeon]